MEFRESPNQQRVKEREEVATPAETQTVITEEPVVATEPVQVRERRRGLFRAELLVWYLLGIVEAFLGIRLILGLLDATGTINNQSGFARFIYAVADPLTRPFYGLFNTATNGEPGIGVIITAMIVYALVGWGIARLLRIGRA